MFAVNRMIGAIDWFIPRGVHTERSELSLARNFVFTHLFGPFLSQAISLFLYLSDPDPGFACWTVIVCIWGFWALPFVYKYTGRLRLAALISTEMLAFVSLFGAYHYGGVSSPFLPWLIVSLLLGFFYLSERPLLVVCIFSANVAGFCAAYWRWGFPELVSQDQLTTVGWISILSATIYMSWMAIYYANMIAMRSDLEREAERHRETTLRLREAKHLADQASRAKSIFLAKMSHELRTPLNAIIGFSEILLEEESTRANSRIKLDLERINAAGKHLVSLVSDVLDLSKIESNQVELNVEPFDLNTLVQDIVAQVQPLLSSRRNRLVVFCASDLGIVSTDPTKLKQAVLNLLTNAAKFTEAGTVTLSVARLRSPGADWIEIAVGDTGIGIAPSELPRLFKNFGQASGATATTYGGTGLGLAISQKLCALMGGGISAVSEPGLGSCFTLRVLAGMNDPAELDRSRSAPLQQAAAAAAF